MRSKNELTLTSACLFVALTVLYIATATRFNTFDAVSYANQIAHLYPRTGNPIWLFHPHQSCSTPPDISSGKP